ncbi:MULTISPECIES: hypothetical protein [Pseudomonas]|uniref:Uncharacterized protein n=1 Tax=Pseudomonas peradeniyensis TaxID=2745488 RepID=A0ABT2V3X5_9PSED|nr:MULTISPECIES: hypothetical protein [Pseudomonas]MCU7236474.1 hypothetical protein [Pseudomonas peradeniyensis]MCU7278266.1 hypothetical protein [Pseudomonas peradeniyensis]QZA54869.1 hypothetical protein K2O50_02070 [Pseudomonas sp. 2hn]
MSIPYLRRPRQKHKGAGKTRKSEPVGSQSGSCGICRGWAIGLGGFEDFSQRPLIHIQLPRNQLCGAVEGNLQSLSIKPESLKALRLLGARLYSCVQWSRNSTVKTERCMLKKSGRTPIAIGSGAAERGHNLPVSRAMALHSFAKLCT